MTDLFLKLAVFSAQVQRGPRGFRQKDVRFLHELLRNWDSDRLERDRALRLHNTQIQRYLDALARAGFARALTRGPHPAFILERSGSLALLRDFRDAALNGSSREFLLVVHVLSSYATRIAETTRPDRRASGASAELRALTDPSTLLSERRAHLQTEIRYWNERIEASRRIAVETKASIARKASPEAIIRAVAETQPYELDYQKPMRELMAETDRSFALWELGEGNLHRIRMLWEPRVTMLEAELAYLKPFKA